MKTIYTVAELKEFVNKLPDNAFVFEQCTIDGKKLMAVTSTWEHTDDGMKTCSYWNFPNVPVLPLTNQDTIDLLTKIYYNSKR